VAGSSTVPGNKRVLVDQFYEHN